jgi:Uma2 family endonuclease
MPVISTAKMTAKQFLRLGEDPPGVRLELVNGEIAVSPSPLPRHSWVEKQLSYFLLGHIRATNLGMLLGDTDTIFGEHDVRRPDLIYFTKEREHLVLEDRAIDGPPDLCVEILSPSSKVIDRRDKFKQYAAAGVRFYWIVDPQMKTIEAFRLTGGRYRAIGRGQGNDTVSLPPFPDLEIPLGQIWFPTRRK